MKIWLAILLLGLVTTGCTTRSNARLREQNAYLSGQNAILKQRQERSDADFQGVTIIGPVQNPKVPWVTGLTLAQALSTANYVGTEQPTQIIITRNGESATMGADALLNGANIQLEIGDIIELH